ncbi:MAG: trypsin-like peptidase domain-containing protein [Candidatus Poribacteria bacterium]|nr:trypsin-like peptidase domain-containing protein [Candidatus Poribacteria bacterium]
MEHKIKALLSGRALCLRIIVLALFLRCGISAANAQTAQQIAQNAFGSTVLLVMEDANGQPVGLGSGFFVRPNQIATNLHVVEDAARGYAKLVGQQTKHDIVGITAIDAKRDWVILRVSALGTKSLSFGDSDAVQVGETVYAVGNPHGLEDTFSQGIISSVRRVGADKILQLTAPISPGSSGGPVLNSKGKVIGVSVATFRRGQNLNFAIPSYYLRALVARVGAAKPLSRAKHTQSKRSILADLGGRSVEGVTAGKFTWSLKKGYKGIIYGIAGNWYSFSLRNRLREAVKNVYYLVIFYDEYGDPIDVDVVEFPGLIPAGLAKRIKRQVSDESVKKMSTRYQATNDLGGPYEQGIITETGVEFRILDFEIVE